MTIADLIDKHFALFCIAFVFVCIVIHEKFKGD